MLNRRQFLTSAAAATFPDASMATPLSARPLKRRLNLGLSGLYYYTGFCPFLNWQKMAAMPTFVQDGAKKLSDKEALSAGYLDQETGEVSRPAPRDLISFTYLFYARPGAGNTAGGYDYSGMRWVVEWDGEAKCVVGGLTTGGTQSIDNDRGRGDFTFGHNPGNTWLTFTITNRRRPPHNIRIYQGHYAKNVAAGEVFNPDWLSQIRAFGVLRFMDWMQTNGSEIRDFRDIADEKYFRWGSRADPAHGQKGGVPLSAICKLANLTRCNIHVNIPHLASDEFVRLFAEYFRDHVDSGLVTTFEYSNECWNFVFPQTRYCWERGTTIWGAADGGRYSKWYGYRSAQCMSIVRSVFGDRARWRGCLATQTVNTGVTNNALLGIGRFLTSASSGEKGFSVRDLFDELAVTGYFGDVQSSRAMTNISNGYPAVVTSPGHGFVNGQKLKLFMNKGMTELNEKLATISNVTSETYELSGIDTTSYKAFVRDNRNYAHPHQIFELMDMSNARFISDPRKYQTKYRYFNELVAASCLTGNAAGFNTSVSVAALQEKFWPAQKAIADANELELRQYEGGLHFVGDAYLAGFGGERQFNEYLFALGHSEQIGRVYAAMYSAFFAVGGHYPAKFVEGGQCTQYGTWAGMRFIPGDEGNPVWRATRKANDD